MMVKNKYNKIEAPLNTKFPCNWSIMKFKEANELITDYVANGSFASLSENVNYKDEEDYAILIRTVDNSNNFKGPFVYIDEHAYNYLSKTKLKPGDVIVSNTGNVGEVFKAPNLNKPMSLGPNIILIRAKEINDYIYYWLESELGQKIMKSITTITAQPKFNKTDLRNSKIAVPPLPEQKKIADILSTVDENIAKTEEVIEKTKELKKGLMQQLLTKGIGHDEFKEVNVGPFKIEIPKNWDVLDFKDVLKEVKSGLSRKLKLEDVGVPVIRSTNMINGKINFDDIKYWYWNDPKGANVENYFLNEGDILVNFINSMAHIGKACIYKDMGRKVIYTTNIFRVRVNKDIVENKYFYYYTLSDYYQSEIERISKQAVNQASFTTGDFKNIFLPLPPLKEQKKIAAILSTVDKKIQKEEEYKEKLELLKKGLMQKLLTGEVRVKVAN